MMELQRQVHALSSGTIATLIRAAQDSHHASFCGLSSNDYDMAIFPVSREFTAFCHGRTETVWQDAWHAFTAYCDAHLITFS
ncbi:hypothetical protein QTV44_002491 [Vibrio vulnificus]|nr:hypothetical protein [Vibrio vulnificus]